MIFLDSNTFWTITSTICSIAILIVTGIYVIVTFYIFRQNKKANQINAYLALKKELNSDIFTLCSSHCSRNKFTIARDNTITETCGYKIESEVLTINSRLFIRDILGNIEDLALFYENDILSFKLIDGGYGYSILHIGNNSSVRDFIRFLKADGSVYNGFGNLYFKIRDSLSYLEKSNYKQNLFEG